MELVLLFVESAAGAKRRGLVIEYPFREREAPSEAGARKWSMREG